MGSLDDSAGLFSDPFAAPQDIDENPHQSKALDSFYASFFKGHPFVLPKARLVNQFDKDPSSVAHVIKAMAFIGALYIPNSASQAYRAAIETAIANHLPRNGFTVQCLLLYAGALEWSGEQDYARSILDKAKSMALDIGLQSRRFARAHSDGCLVLAESWRRTWWELYIIDAIFGGIGHLPTFALWHAEYDADLPCEEMDYIQGNIPPPRTLAEYDDRAFEDGDGLFSSFAYLIDASRMLGTALPTVDEQGDDTTSQVKNAEANITSWHLYLPESKKEPVQPDGSVDEVMFRAHMLLNTVTTHLHRPRSRLHYSTMEILCSRYAPPQNASVLEVFNERHTMQAVNAAKALVQLFTLSASPTTHSPFIMCMGSMAAATHISACEYYLKGSEYAHAKDRVRVFLGALRAFEDIWPQARKWSGEVKLMAKAVFDSRGKNGELIVQNQQDGVGSGLGAGVAGLDLALLRSCFES
ncbi:C6 zinc finger domain-containing protein, partial [Metarhizium hybridum]